jgi:hypothetical protein
MRAAAMNRPRQSEGFCSYCERSIRITSQGVMAPHRAHGQPGRGAPEDSCPGSELTPRMARDLAVIDALRSSARDWPAGSDT